MLRAAPPDFGTAIVGVAAGGLAAANALGAPTLVDGCADGLLMPWLSWTRLIQGMSVHRVVTS